MRPATRPSIASRSSADSEQFDGSVELAGGLTKTGWSGELASLKFKAAGPRRCSRCASPRASSTTHGSFSLSQTCLEDAPTVLCSALKFEASGALDAGYSFEQVPLKLANTLAPEALAGRAAGRGAGSWPRAARHRWPVDRRPARVTSESARLVMAEGEKRCRRRRSPARARC